MDPIAIGGAISSFKTLTEIAQSFLQVRDTALIQGKVVELTSAIIAAQNETMAIQASQAPLVARVDELEKEIVRLEDWKTEKQRYELVSIDGRTVAYMAKAGMENGEPPHWLCTKCFQHGRASIVQFQGVDSPRAVSVTFNVYKCAECGAGFGVQFTARPQWIRNRA